MPLRHRRVHVVVQVPADAGQVVHDAQAQRRQLAARPDSRQQQDLRRQQRAGGHQHLVPRADLLEPAGTPELHAAGAPAFEQHAGGVRAGEHGEVAAAPVGRQVGPGRAEALAVPVRDLVRADAFLLRAVEVVVEDMARRAARVVEGLQQLVGAAQVRHVERAGAPVELAAQALVVLGAAEVGQHVVVGPARVALGRPVVVVGTVAADVDHRVDRARAAQHLAARLPAGAPVQALLRHGVEVPVRGVRAGHQREAGGHVDQRVGVGRAGLEQRHRDLRILAQACRQHAAGGAAAHHDVVEVHALSLCRCRPGTAGCRNRLAPPVWGGGPGVDTDASANKSS